jgi:hypothetical protein
MGVQHGQQVLDLLPELVLVMDRRLETLAQCSMDFTSHISRVTRLWEEYARGTMAMLRGIAQALDLEWDRYFRYTIASYLEDLAKCGLPQDGCTTWAAGPPVTTGGAKILVKNRDYRPDHQALQCLAYAEPEEGYPYAYVTSAGSPGVFSSGMNAMGLAVADTHVHSLDVGPGIARYSAMMDILENHDTVPAALSYLHSVPHTGNGTMILLDKTGDMAVFEIAHSKQMVVKGQNGTAISTNHFTSPALSKSWEDRSSPELQGNSVGRYDRIKRGFQDDTGQVDPGWAQALMSAHGDPLNAICRHARVDPGSMTISTVIFLPQSGQFYLGNDQPCRTEAFTLYTI